MANQRRSIWEIRFYALQETLRREREHKKYMAGSRALNDDDFGDSVDRDVIRENINMLDKLISRSQEIETKKSPFIFLKRDSG